MSTPKRIQRKRTKGWKMPENTISVTRPGKWGNPFKVGNFVKLGEGGDGFAFLVCNKEEFATNKFIKVKDNAHAVELYREYRKRYPLSKKQIQELKGKNLACFCPLDQPCHADVLLELANQ